MVKSLILVSFLFSSWTQAFESSPCANLSHISKLGAGDVHFKQIGCDKVERETFVQGEAMGDISTFDISDNWAVINTNDENETVVNNQRWMWSLDKTKIIHEFTVDTISKTDGSRDFMSGSDVFEISNDIVKKSSAFLRRKETTDGNIKTESKSTTTELPRLK